MLRTIIPQKVFQNVNFLFLYFLKTYRIYYIEQKRSGFRSCQKYFDQPSPYNPNLSKVTFLFLNGIKQLQENPSIETNAFSQSNTLVFICVAWKNYDRFPLSKNSSLRMRLPSALVSVRIFLLHLDLDPILILLFPIRTAITPKFWNGIAVFMGPKIFQQFPQTPFACCSWVFKKSVQKIDPLSRSFHW